MFANTFVVALLAVAATGLPGPVIEPRQGTGFRGRCILSTNRCNVTDPVGATGIMLNCAAGGGFNGQIGAGQGNCTVDGHVSARPLTSGIIEANFWRMTSAFLRLTLDGVRG